MEIIKNNDSENIQIDDHIIKKNGMEFIYKSKEYYIIRHILDKYKHYDWKINKNINKNTAVRPDMILDLDDRIIIIEIDENQHKSYKNDNIRINKINDNFYYKNVFIIRFNPDEYYSKNILYQSCWSKQNNRYIISDKQQLIYRLNELEKIINNCITCNSTEPIELIYLFYDQKNNDNKIIDINNIKNDENKLEIDNVNYIDNEIKNNFIVDKNNKNKKINEHKCNLCNKIFSRKVTLNNHIKNKICINKKYSCTFCGRKYNNTQNTYRHMKRCPKNEINIINCNNNIANNTEYINGNNNAVNNTIDDLIDTLDNVINDDLDNINNRDNENLEKIRDIYLKKLINSLVKLNKNKNVNTNIINNKINNKVNATTLIAYGKEDMSKIDKNDLLKAFRLGFNSTIKLTEIVHFNPKYPEYHNIYIPSAKGQRMKDKYAMKYNGIEWELVNKNDLIESIYDDKKNYIEVNLNDFVNSLTKSQKDALRRWMDVADEDDKIKSIKENMKLLLYNKRSTPIRNKKTNKRNVEIK